MGLSSLSLNDIEKHLILTEILLEDIAEIIDTHFLRLDCTNSPLKPTAVNLNIEGQNNTATSLNITNSNWIDYLSLAVTDTAGSGVTASGGDLTIESLDADIKLKLYDNAGGRKVSVIDSDTSEVASIDSDGLGIFTNLDVDTLNLNGNVISDSTGTVSFDNEDLTTTGTVQAEHLYSTDDVVIDDDLTVGDGTGTSQIIAKGTAFPVGKFVRYTTAGSGTYGAMALERVHSDGNGQNGFGVGQYFLLEDGGGNEGDFAGFFGARWHSATSGSETGELIFTPAKNNDDPWNDTPTLIVRATTAGGSQTITIDSTPKLYSSSGTFDFDDDNITSSGNLTLTGAASELIVDTTTLVVNASGYADRVGIGTATPPQELSFGASTPVISTDTSDGSDNKRLDVTAGGAFGSTRGAGFSLFGNEHANKGYCQLIAGNPTSPTEWYHGALIFQTGGVNRFVIDVGGDTGIGITSPTAKFHIDQSSATGAKPVLRLDQGDIDDSFIDFIGTSAADGSRSISTDTTENSAKFGAIRIEINGVTKWIRIYDDES